MVRVHAALRCLLALLLPTDEWLPACPAGRKLLFVPLCGSQAAKAAVMVALMRQLRPEVGGWWFKDLASHPSGARELGDCAARNACARAGGTTSALVGSADIPSTFDSAGRLYGGLPASLSTGEQISVLQQFGGSLTGAAAVSSPSPVVHSHAALPSPSPPLALSAGLPLCLPGTLPAAHSHAALPLGREQPASCSGPCAAYAAAVVARAQPSACGGQGCWWQARRQGEQGSRPPRVVPIQRGISCKPQPLAL